MDWLDEKLEVLGKWIHNLSLRKALVFYIITSVIIIIILYAVTISVCERIDNRIWSLNENVNEQASQGITVYYHDYSILSGAEKVYARIINFIKVWCILIYSIGGILGVSLSFYNRKLKQPLQILKGATNQVGKSNLDFEIYYDSKDEMGDLCHSFDLMRSQLIMNNQKMWDMMEEQKRLNSAFAHDLRTPLTVLRGYNDFLSTYLPEGKVSEEKLLSTLSMMSCNIDRLERYSNTMKEIYSMEDIPVHQIFVSYGQLMERIEKTVEVINNTNGIEVQLTVNEKNNSMILLDEAILMEVLENLLSNAIRYANNKVLVIITLKEFERRLLLSVIDDGKGFSTKDLTMATKPYYTESSKKRSNHFGIGLYICKLLCVKHGGRISLANSIQQGAVVTAEFSTSDLNQI